MSQRKSRSAQGQATDKPVIYAVDDEVMILELFTVLLEPLGYRVLTFSDPARALESLSASLPRPALIITDYAMHSLNGMELIERCRAIAPDQKILLASGTVGEDIFASAPTRPDRFISKPFKTRELVAAVRELIGP